MTAPKTKTTKEYTYTQAKSVQFIVFAPVNGDPDNEENHIYMVCPSSLRVVEVVEKFGVEAEKYLTRLGKRKIPTNAKPADVENIDISHISDDIIEDNSSSKKPLATEEELNSIEDEVDVLEIFANEELTSVFPESSDNSKYDPESIDSILDDDLSSTLDEDPDAQPEEDLEAILEDFSDEESLPTL